MLLFCFMVSFPILAFLYRESFSIFEALVMFGMWLMIWSIGVIQYKIEKIFKSIEEVIK